MKISEIIKYFTIWQILIFIIVLIAGNVLPLREQYLGGATQAYVETPQLYFRANFDGNHYSAIAKYGYGYAEQAFFPLFPRLIKSISVGGISPILAGIIVSNISFILALYIFSKLLRMDYKEATVRWIIIALLIFPVSFYFTSVYTESLFFLLVVSSFYSSRKQKWGLALIFGALACYTRLAGIFLVPALIFELITSKNKSWLAWFSVLLIPTGLLLYMIYLYQTTGDALLFMHAQQLFGQSRSEKIILPYQVFWRYAKMLLTVPKTEYAFTVIVLELSVGILFFITSIVSFFKIRFSYAIFSSLSFILPTLTGTFASLPRYVLMCFSSFIIFGIILHESRLLVRLMYILSSLAFLFVYLSLFSRGYWVS